ncbi:MAG: signal peptidase II [Clostridia bacterium]|nr:signal peptidase II [Clostridia bacterium]
MMVLIIALSLMADLVTKRLATLYLQNTSFPVIKNVLHLTYVENTGAAFGMYKGGRWFFIITTVLILCGIVFMLIKYKPQQKLVKVSSALVMAGAVGNLIDRIYNGFVVDFIDFRVINYPVFNIADCCVVVGAVLFAVWVIFFEKK